MMSTYQATPQGPHAKIGFLNNHMFSNENVAALYDGEDYKTCKKPFKVPMFGKPMLINAGTPKTIVVDHVVGYDRLHFAFSFIPKANQIYLIKTLSHKHNGSITTALQLLKTNGKRQTALPVVQRVYQVGAVNSFCVDSDIKLATAPKVTTINQVAQNVPLVYQWMENDKGKKK